MIKVCDAIMGNGKTQSAITLMNENPDRKYIFITPYLDEASRIRRSCPDLDFIEPKTGLSNAGYTKLGHTQMLIKEGCNIATTHQAFKFYTQETLDDIREQGYTLIIDENVDVLEKYEASPEDLEMLVDKGYLNENNGIYSLGEREYHGIQFTEVIKLVKTRDLVRISDGKDEETFFWMLPPDLLTAFDDVYILTYLFTGQGIHHFMKIYDINYEYIGIERDGDTYRFCDYPGYTPEYTKSLQDKIHIIDNEKLNAIGDEEFSLSMSWFNRETEGVKQLKNNIYNVFNNILDFIPAEQRMWGCHKNEYTKLKGKGYTKGFVIFNIRATNKLRNKTCLVYTSNIYMNVGEKLLYKSLGIDVNEDEYALSTMIQWIWRSAIRDGEDIYLYIPSKRMRTLLINWIDMVSGTKDRNLIREEE